MVWTLVEPGVAIVAASLATIRPLLRAMRVAGFDSTDYAGPSGARSGTNRSGTNRGTLDQSRKGAEEVELDPVRREGAEDILRNYSRPRKFQGQERVEVKSEMYVIEGARARGAGLGVAYDEEIPSSMSSFDFGGVEAHSQDDGRVGLGVPGR